MYPVLSANIMGAFNCRDLGTHTGVYLRGDFALSCESDTYRAVRLVAIVGIIFIPIGVPVFFAVLIFYRDSHWLKQPSFFLHGHFLPRWRYFEVLDLVRKLVLTSLAPYIGEVDSTTQCLFLLVVDTASLVLLAFSRPYQISRDDFLSLVLGESGRARGRGSSLESLPLLFICYYFTPTKLPAHIYQLRLPAAQ